jgi:vanillate O-demethylase ferredoxin subunit
MGTIDCKPAADPGSFVLHLARSGRSIRVGRDDTILSALNRAGIHVTTGCTAGTCGICETRVIAGTPQHRDQLIPRDGPASAKSLMICCSRSLTPELTLDL